MGQHQPIIETPVEFWRMKRVIAVTGLSRTEIYRRVAAGYFPLPRKYLDSIMNFWLSTDIKKWQLQQLANE
jgi:predicted DNA-binding transcriptional regulator AlpA